MNVALRLHGDADRPALVYLPGLHGDWTLVGAFRRALAARVRFVEISYPSATDWSLVDYANAVAEALVGNHVSHGWLLAESFGSQVAWAMLARPCHFQADGLILAGGFVRHPWPAAVRMTRRALERIRFRQLCVLLRVYAVYAHGRYGFRGGAVRTDLAEFLSRRDETDRQGAAHRLRLIEGSDWESVARSVRLPVYYLSGLWDPVVPWPWVWRWLRRNCPALKGCRLVWWSDHNVLGAAAESSARQALRWMDANSGGAGCAGG